MLEGMGGTPNSVKFFYKISGLFDPKTQFLPFFIYFLVFLVHFWAEKKKYGLFGPISNTQTQPFWVKFSWMKFSDFPFRGGGGKTGKGRQ